MILLAYRSGRTTPAVADLQRMDDWVIVLEVLVLIAVIVSLGPVLRAWLNVWGVLLLTTIVFGMIVPLVLSWRGWRLREVNTAVPAILVLVGGFLLRIIIVFSSESV